MRTDTPKTLQETLRVVGQRLRKLEAASNQVRVGDWTLSEDDAGNLVATDSSGNDTTIASA